MLIKQPTPNSVVERVTMAEIRCDSATLHVYTDDESDKSMSDSQIGERQFFDERGKLVFPLLGDRGMRVYAVLWNGNQPVTCTYNDWVHPGGTYEVDASVVVRVDGKFLGEEFFDYYDAPTVFCKWPECRWQETVSWGGQEAAFKKHFQAEHVGPYPTEPRVEREPL
jgi:hypothetical protein